MFASKDLFLTRPSGYQISRSVRLRSSASAYFNRTNGTPTSGTTWTISFWIKRGSNLGTQQNIMGAGQTSGTNYFQITFDAGNTLTITDIPAGNSLITTQVFRDPSAWYHIIYAFDTTQATASNRAKLYVNGTQVTAFSTASYPALNAVSYWNTNAYVRAIGNIWYNGAPGGFYFDGYLTEINFIDGQALTPSSFGKTNAVTGVWQPIKYTGTYGTNGFYLNFSDNSAATATTIGKDYSGNGNNWTPNNISVTAGTTYDSMLDVPTLYADGGNGRGNYATWNPLKSVVAPTNGNLTVSSPGLGGSRATQAFSSGKWYWEVTVSTGTIYVEIGVVPVTLAGSTDISSVGANMSGYYAGGSKILNGAFTAYGASFTTGDVIGVAVDADANTIQFYKNNTAQGSFTMATSSGTEIQPAVGDANNAASVTNINFGQRPFTYTPPTGFVALNTQNLPTPTISNGATVMAATLYAANGSTQTISNAVNGISMQPDFVWVKSRQYTTVGHSLFDALRPIGVNSSLPRLVSNSTDAETNNGGLTAFVSNGFSLNNDAYINSTSTGGNMVAWQWNAGGSTVTNNSGSISAQVRANATAGFSVVTYTGTGANATVGHGLGVAPSMIIVKNRSSGTTDWAVYHKNLTSAAYYLWLNSTQAQATSAIVWNSTTPTSSVFSIGTGSQTNGSTNSMVAYCFAAVAGYSAFGSYTGNGSADGPFVYLGFRPRYLLIKSAVVAGGTWVVFDSARSTYNVTGEKLAPNTADLENSGATGIAGGVDFLSNGFKIRLSWGDINTSNTLIYAAFAENPFKLSLAR